MCFNVFSVVVLLVVSCLCLLSFLSRASRYCFVPVYKIQIEAQEKPFEITYARWCLAMIIRDVILKRRDLEGRETLLEVTKRWCSGFYGTISQLEGLPKGLSPSVQWIDRDERACFGFSCRQNFRNMIHQLMHYGKKDVQAFMWYYFGFGGDTFVLDASPPCRAANEELFTSNSSLCLLRLRLVHLANEPSSS